MRHALDSLLAQDYENFEILISDNASTDGTEAICREYSDGDIRIKYFRQNENIGAKKNFEFLASEARGEYFALCAHDDLRYPRFISACVKAFERQPSAVLCNGKVEFLDEQGSIRKNWSDLNFSTLGMSKVDRMLKLIDHTHWVEIMGLIKTDAFRKALPFEYVWGFDVVFCMKLLAFGDFIKAPEVLFSYRVRSTPKSEEQTMKEVMGSNAICTNPWLEMLKSLLLVALESIPAQQEREIFFYSYLHTIIGTLRLGPYPSWLELVATESGGDMTPEVVPYQLAKHLLACLKIDSTFDSYFNSNVRNILLGCPREQAILTLVPEIVNTLRLHFKNARILLIGSQSVIEHIPHLGEDKRFNTPSQWAHQAIASLLNDLRGEHIDVAINLGVNRKDPALDICISNSGAIRTIGFKAPHKNIPRAILGAILKRFRIKDINGSFSHSLCLSSQSNLINTIMKALGVSSEALYSSSKPGTESL